MWEFVIVFFLITLALFLLFLVGRDGGYWTGWYNVTGTITEECTQCDGYGSLWLEPAGDTTRIVKIPTRFRLINPDGTENKQSLPALGNLKECDACGGMGEIHVSRGPERFMRLPFPWPWRKL